MKATTNITFREAIEEIKSRDQPSIAASEAPAEQQTDNDTFKTPQAPAPKSQNAWVKPKTQMTKPNDKTDIHRILLLLIQSTLLLLSKIGGEDVTPIINALTSFNTLLQHQSH